MSRKLALLLGVVVLTGVVGVSAAAATVDWTSGMGPVAKYRNFSSEIYGARSIGTIYWKGYEVSFDGETRDTARDRRGAALELRYAVYYSHAWHRHHFFIADAFGKGVRTVTGPKEARFPMRNVHARSCLVVHGKHLNSPDRVITCDPKWR
jgi:hypothetical protein